MTPNPLSMHAFLLKGFALSLAEDCYQHILDIDRISPFRQLLTPGGRPLSAAMTNCGDWGWISDHKGYRYETKDPNTDRSWPNIPLVFLDLAKQAAEACGFVGFTPDSCLINRYAIGNKMGLHQDKDEKDLTAPIVSVSLGLPIAFKWGGLSRRAKAITVPLSHGDVVVWGLSDRLRFHGVLTLKAGYHDLTGPYRFNLTFRKAK